MGTIGFVLFSSANKFHSGNKIAINSYVNRFEKANLSIIASIAKPLGQGYKKVA